MNSLARPVGFTATRVDELQATEFTLVTIVVDQSGSVQGFQEQITKSLKNIVEACRKAPRADNLLLRVLLFDHNLREFHGFKPLMDCDTDSYSNIPAPYGDTALFDATENAILATNAYAEELSDNQYDANALVIVITDGMENKSNNASIQTIRGGLAKAVKAQHLESLMTILVGVNLTDPAIKAHLDDFREQAGFTHFQDVGSADEKTMVKFAGWVSSSISSQSQALGTGSMSKVIVF